MNLLAKGIASPAVPAHRMSYFALLMNVVTAFDYEVSGRIPEALKVRFLRIGPTDLAGNSR